MSGPPQPHDGVARWVLGDPRNAASQFRAMLPESLVARLDLDRLARVDASFVDGELSKRYMDVLFTVPLDGREALIYVLLEHQSGTDRAMPVRMLQYVTRIWERHLALHTKTRLPVVVPLVLHHDLQPWSGPVEIRDMLDLDGEWAEALDPFVPRFRFLLDDLAKVDEDALRERPLTPAAGLALVLLKTARGNVDMDEVLRAWADRVHALLAQPDGVAVLKVLVTYIESVAETPDDVLYRVFEELGPEAKEAYMTTAEMLMAKGRAKTLLQQLDIKFGPLAQNVIDTVLNATSEQLDTWTERILSADSLDDVIH